MAIRDNLRKKIVVSGGGGSSGGGSGSGTGGSGTSAIDGGYTINFHNTDNVLVESHSALFGNYIDKPLSISAKNWLNANGHVNSFPLTVTESMGVESVDLYQSEKTLSSILYDLFSDYGFTKETHPYICIKHDSYNGYNYIYVFFAKSLTTSTGTYIQVASGSRFFKSTLAYRKYSAEEIVNYISDNIAAFLANTGTNGEGFAVTASSLYTYFNFNVDGATNLTVFE